MTWYVPIVGSEKILCFCDSGWTKRGRDHLSKLKVTTYCCSAKNRNCQRNHFVDWRHLGFLQRGSEAKISDISERFLDITITGHLLLLMLSPEDLRELNIKERAVMVSIMKTASLYLITPELTDWCLTFWGLQRRELIGVKTMTCQSVAWCETRWPSQKHVCGLAQLTTWLTGDHLTTWPSVWNLAISETASSPQRHPREFL